MPAHHDNVDDEHAKEDEGETTTDANLRENSSTLGLERAIVKVTAPGHKWIFFVEDTP